MSCNDQKLGFERLSMVWVRIKGFPVWPAVVVTMADVPEREIKVKPLSPNPALTGRRKSKNQGQKCFQLLNQNELQSSDTMKKSCSCDLWCTLNRDVRHTEDRQCSTDRR